VTPAKPRAAAPGDVLGDRYTLKRIEWTSALGPVWLARDRVLDRAVLVQLLDPALAADQATRRAFQKAAARTAQIGAPGLLQVYDIGDQPAFAVLEHASGGRLIDRLGAGPMRTTDAARTALAVARGLESLHERGSWHGALSPSTVLFDEEGRAKIFATGTADTARTNPKIKVASEQPAEYRTPEKDPIPADADRYALAALTYEMLTGSPPEPGVSARAKRRGVPVQIDELLARALSADPTTRPSLDEFEAALAPFARVVPKDVKEPRFALAEFRWLVPVIVVVVLAILAITLGVEVANNLGNKKKASPTASSTASIATVAIKSAHDFDPRPGNGSENPQQVPDAYDGDQASSWSTLDYSTPDVGGKRGVGLVFDLGSVVQIGRVQLQTSIPGWDAEIRVADQDGTTAADFTVVKTITAGTGITTVTLPGGTRARYVLLWITRLVNNNTDTKFPYSATINEIRFYAS
jgi:serine/threonine protein kinase